MLITLYRPYPAPGAALKGRDNQQNKVTGVIVGPSGPKL